MLPYTKQQIIFLLNNENQILQQQFYSQFINELPKDYDIWIEYNENNGINGYYMNCIRINAFQIEINDQSILNEKTLHVNGGVYLKDFVNKEIKIVGYSKNGNLIPFDASIENIIIDQILCSKTTIIEFDRIPNIRIKKFELFDDKSDLLIQKNE